MSKILVPSRDEERSDEAISQPATSASLGCAPNAVTFQLQTVVRREPIGGVDIQILHDRSDFRLDHFEKQRIR